MQILCTKCIYSLTNHWSKFDFPSQNTLKVSGCSSFLFHFIFCKSTTDDRLYSFCSFVSSIIIATMVDCTHQIPYIFFRLAYSLQHADCAGAVFYSIMKSALVAAQSTNSKFFNRWQEYYEQPMTSLKLGMVRIQEVWLLYLREGSSLYGVEDVIFLFTPKWS